MLHAFELDSKYIVRITLRSELGIWVERKCDELHWGPISASRRAEDTDWIDTAVFALERSTGIRAPRHRFEIIGEPVSHQGKRGKKPYFTISAEPRLSLQEILAAVGTRRHEGCEIIEIPYKKIGSSGIDGRYVQFLQRYGLLRPPISL